MFLKIMFFAVNRYNSLPIKTYKYLLIFGVRMLGNLTIFWKLMEKNCMISFFYVPGANLNGNRVSFNAWLPKCITFYRGNDTTLYFIFLFHCYLFNRLN